MANQTMLRDLTPRDALEKAREARAQGHHVEVNPLGTDPGVPLVDLRITRKEANPFRLTDAEWAELHGK